MPVVVPPEAFDLWLDCANVDAETAAALIVPAADNLLEAFEVSTAVNRTANDNAQLVEPWSAPAEAAAVPKPVVPRAPRKRIKNPPKKDDGQGALF
jgi:hypothetical protein